jgi:hypothetical protein
VPTPRPGEKGGDGHGRGDEMTSDHRRLDWLGAPHLLALAGVALMAVSAAVGLGLFEGRGLEKAMAPPADAPAWETGAVACREEPMVGVPHPTRFLVIAACSTVSGTVRQIRRDPADGELNMLIAVDRSYERFLPRGNDGVLRVAVVPRDIPKLTIPRVGQHATLYGAWVLDRNQHNQGALHPVWKIKLSSSGNEVVADPGQLATGPATVVGKRMLVHLQAPLSVPVGGAINMSVRVESATKTARRPEPEAHLFFEVRTQDDRGVQWKSATTNALGRARVTLVALEHPGSFRIWLYVDKMGSSAVVSTPVNVRRR